MTRLNGYQIHDNWYKAMNLVIAGKARLLLNQKGVFVRTTAFVPLEEFGRRLHTRTNLASVYGFSWAALSRKAWFYTQIYAGSVEAKIGIRMVHCRVDSHK